VAGLTLDAGALIAYERGDDLVRAWLQEAFDRAAVPTVPSVVVAQTCAVGVKHELRDYYRLVMWRTLTSRWREKPGRYEGGPARRTWWMLLLSCLPGGGTTWFSLPIPTTLRFSPTSAAGSACADADPVIASHRRFISPFGAARLA